VLPARELLGDMFMELHQPARALEAYEANLQQHPNRLNAVYGAGLAAKRTGDGLKATAYFQQLISLAGNASNERIEIKVSRQFLKEHAIQ
jgi:tetratricopeptide (TPR) repeat protein